MYCRIILPGNLLQSIPLFVSFLESEHAALLTLVQHTIHKVLGIGGRTDVVAWTANFESAVAK